MKKKEIKKLDKIITRLERLTVDLIEIEERIPNLIPETIRHQADKLNKETEKLKDWAGTNVHGSGTGDD